VSSPIRVEEILLPVKGWFVTFTVFAAVMLNLLPWGGFAGLVRPDFVAVIIAYWTLKQPQLVGIGIAWTLGLVMDIADGSLFGQHALAYGALAFAGVTLHRRLRMFGLREQVAHVLALLVATRALVAVVALAAGKPFPGWSYFIGPLIGAALWPPLAVLLQLPQKPTPNPDKL
jgi:rod shape-determining protein MreD